VARNAYDGVCSIDGKIYFVGGWDGNASTTFELYNASTNSWNTLPPLNSPRAGIASAVLNGKLYVIGGEGYSSLDIFDPVSELWSSGQPLPHEVRKGAAISIAGKIYLTGGQNALGERLKKLFEYNPITNQWTQKANMQYARHGLKVIHFDGRIWALGGRNNSTLDKVESYVIEENIWRTEASLSVTRDWPSAWATEDGIFVAGGDNAGTILSSIEFYNRHSGQWNLVGNLPAARRNSGIAVIKNKVYQISGTDSSFNYSNKVYAADLPAPTMNLYFKDGNASGTGCLGEDWSGS
jgi:N-acetylneuraminic acid mutarotase